MMLWTVVLPRDMALLTPAAISIIIIGHITLILWGMSLEDVQIRE